MPGQGSRCVGGLEHRPQCGCVGGGIVGREAPGGKELPCIRVAWTWPSWEAVSFLSQMLHAHDLSLRGIRWLTTQEAPPPEAPRAWLPAAPTSPPQMHHSARGGRGQGLLREGPALSLPSIPSGLPRQLKCPMGPQGTKHDIPKIRLDAKVIFLPDPRRRRLLVPQNKACDRPGGVCSEAGQNTSPIPP